ncbi:lipid A deacylase LpxR family protein [bacterium SCSIO 12696]|nr:lipid A deacylase LpxR family protein [bacterium SCSIO 12696]
MRSSLQCLLFSSFFVLPTVASAEAANSPNTYITDTPVQAAGDSASQEPTWSKWAISFDNDILVPGTNDRDYTYGFNLVLSGAGARSKWYSPYRALNWLDRGFGVSNRADSGLERVTLETGVFAFTPEDITTAEPIEGERPYSSLVYLSSVRQQIDADNEVAWDSSLTLGVLGLPLVGSVQNQLHDLLGGDEANGWNNQISDGGELTARYAVSRQNNWQLDNDRLEVKTAVQGSVGYLSEVAWSFNVRAGEIHSPWWSFNPHLASYGQQSSEIAVSTQAERYFWFGAAVKARAYNALLQGQFRDSEVSYSSGEVNHLLVEAWAGYTLAFDGGYRISYMVRGQSSELKQGLGDRHLLWGGVTFSKAF